MSLSEESARSERSLRSIPELPILKGRGAADRYRTAGISESTLYALGCSGLMSSYYQSTDRVADMGTRYPEASRSSNLPRPDFKTIELCSPVWLRGFRLRRFSPKYSGTELRRILGDAGVTV